MLSERGLQIIEKLIDNNRIPITSKTLALYMGVSERSVKTYIKEVSDFCNEHGMVLERKPGLGFMADFTEEQIEQINELKRDKKIVMSKKQRMGYIMYILLSGWDTYTLSLFSEELNVSKKMIGDDINTISRELKKYGIKINRVAGHGVFITGDEFSIRKAMRSCCTYAIGSKDIKKTYDYRISIEEGELWINNFGQDNFEKAIEVIHKVEKSLGVAYTDYSFRMLAEYLSIQLFRTRMGNVITEDIASNYTYISNPKLMDVVTEGFCELGKVKLNEYEKQYIDVLFASAAVQSNENRVKTVTVTGYEEKNKIICTDMLEYLSEILNVDLTENDLLRTSLEGFLPASLIRTQYGIEVSNPFLGDIREMYSGIFATCFTLGKFYEEHCNAIPTDHEISFIALYLGGALHRNVKSVKAVLIGTSGIAAANIVARKIENGIDNVKIVAILSSEQIDSIDNYEFDLILSLSPNFEYYNKVIYISPIISKKDEKRIKDACFEVLAHPKLEKEDFVSIIDERHIMVINEKTDRESVLNQVCKQLCIDGYVNDKFFHDVLKRENIEPTAIGNGVAIPHGMPENVLKPKVAVVKVKYPINWGGKMVSVIFVLALNFNNIGNTKAFFSDFSRMVSSKEKIDRICSLDNEKEIESVLKEELHWA